MSKLAKKVSIAEELNGTHKEEVMSIIKGKYNHLQRYWAKQASVMDKMKYVPYLIEGELDIPFVGDKSNLSDLELHILDSIREHNDYYKVVFYNKHTGFWLLVYNYQWSNVQVDSGILLRTNHPTLYVIDSEKFEDGIVRGMAYYNVCLRNEVTKGIRLLIEGLF